MEDLQIIKQLYHGNHLENSELERAKQLIHSLNVALKQRGVEEQKQPKILLSDDELERLGEIQ